MTRPLSLIAVSTAALALAACAHRGSPPEISLDEPAPAVTSPFVSGISSPVPVAALSTPLPLPMPMPRQLDPLPRESVAAEPASPASRVARANREARVQPSRYGYVNATQVWPFASGSLYQVYTSPGKVTDIALQEGEQLTSVSAGDTVRWVIGDTTSGSGESARVHILIKPTRPALRTNLVVNTDRRTYHLELAATPETWMASVSWDYPQDRLLAIEAPRAEMEAAPTAEIPVELLRFRYTISGDKPPWRPIAAFDDGSKVYIQFPAAIAQGELPPVFVVGPGGESQLVNARFRSPYYVVDRLFGSAELRLGGPKQQVVRIERTKGKRRRGSPSS